MVRCLTVCLYVQQEGEERGKDKDAWIDLGNNRSRGYTNGRVTFPSRKLSGDNLCFPDGLSENRPFVFGNNRLSDKWVFHLTQCF